MSCGRDNRIKDVTSFLLSMIVVAGGLYIIYHKPELKTEIVGMIIIILSYHFGSSRGSQAKDDTISDALRDEGREGKRGKEGKEGKEGKRGKDSTVT